MEVNFLPGGLLVANFVKDTTPITVRWGKDTSLQVTSGFTLNTSSTISRYLARIASSYGLYGSTVLERTEASFFSTSVYFFMKGHALGIECIPTDSLHNRVLHLACLVIFLLNIREGLSCHF
jgi:hypothetical protein